MSPASSPTASAVFTPRTARSCCLPLRPQPCSQLSPRWLWWIQSLQSLPRVQKQLLQSLGFWEIQLGDGEDQPLLRRLSLWLQQPRPGSPLSLRRTGLRSCSGCCCCCCCCSND